MTSHTAPDLKARHRAMWALGDYPSVASDVIAELGEVLVSATGITATDRVLDIAAGSGNASLPAARTGATVVASDLTPALLDAGRRAAAAASLELAWDVADAEDLPYPDASFDVAISCVGIMFAPYHERSAAELVRVVRPGGRIGLVSWTPEGFIGQMFAALKPFAAAPPPGATPPPRWGSPEHLTMLLGESVHELRTQRQMLQVDAFPTPEDFRDFFVERYGPVVAARAAIADQQDRVTQVDAALADLARRHLRPDGTMAWEYLLATARRA